MTSTSQEQNSTPPNSEKPKISFVGSFAQIVDSKNRISIPQRFRDVLNREYGDEDLRVMTTITLDRNIAVFPISNFYKFLDTVDEDIPAEQRHKKRHRRMVFEGCSDTDRLDNQNRVRINPMLLKHAGIKRDIYVIGFTDRIEVWDRQKWDQFIESQIQSLPDTLSES
jgi:MraZ protein